MVGGLGFWVWSVEFEDESLGFRVEVLGCRVWG